MTLASTPGGEPGDDRRQAAASRPLVIAVDRILVPCDLVLETLITYVKLDARRLVDVLAWSRRGRSFMEAQLADRVPIDADALPLNEPLAKFASARAAAGQEVFLLASSTKAGLAKSLEGRLPFVVATITFPERDPHPCVIGEVLAKRFPLGFDYAGGAHADLDIWRHAATAVLVGASPAAKRRIAAAVPVSASMAGASRLKGLVQSLRVHQWVKNLLVFAPLLLGGKLAEPGSLLATIVAFLAMCLVASSTYLLNDIVDAADDRRHWSKRERPIAKGYLPASTATAWAAAGLTIGLVAAAGVTWLALGVLLLYTGLTLSYSLGLKRLPLIDGLVLATLYTLRLALGVVAAEVPPSPWLFIFSMFLFTSLSLTKRLTELGRMGTAHGASMAGRGYRSEDAPLVLAVGVAAALGAIIILVLYIMEDAYQQSFYGRTSFLWGFPPLVFLLMCRTWLMTVRGQMNDDPVRFMMSDRVSQCLLAVLVACFTVAWLG
jgi:4-hydroxybenzoate polyprenyltransferase